MEPNQKNRNRHFWQTWWNVAKARKDPDYLDRLAFEGNLLRNGAIQGAMLDARAFRESRVPMGKGAWKRAPNTPTEENTNPTQDD